MTDKSIEGAKEFLLQEYQSLLALHQDTKAVGETRLNFFITFVAATSTIVITIQPLIAAELRAWLLSSVVIVLFAVGLITYRKMLQRRIAIVIFRRRMSRIRAWFVKYYPAVVTGLPFDVSQDIRMDWGGKHRLGSTAISVVFVNTALIVVSIPAIAFAVYGLNAVVWGIPAGILGGCISWFFHIKWKNKWMEDAEARDQKEIQALDEISLQATSPK